MPLRTCLQTFTPPPPLQSYKNRGRDSTVNPSAFFPIEKKRSFWCKNFDCGSNKTCSICDAIYCNSCQEIYECQECYGTFCRTCRVTENCDICSEILCENCNPLFSKNFGRKKGGQLTWFFVMTFFILKVQPTVHFWNFVFFRLCHWERVYRLLPLLPHYKVIKIGGGTVLLTLLLFFL